MIRSFVVTTLALLVLSGPAWAQHRHVIGSEIAPDPSFLSGEKKSEFASDILRTQAMDSLSSPTAETIWVLTVWLDTMRELEVAQEWTAIDTSKDVEGILAQLTALADEKVGEERIQALAPPRAPDFDTLAVQRGRIVDLLMAEETRMELIRTNQLRGQLDKLQMALAEWDRVKEDPTLLTSDEKRRATAAARQGLVELDVQENLARSNLEQLEFREEQWNKRLKKSEDELSQLTSATMGGLNPEAGEELVKLREKAAEIRSERDQAAIQIEEVRGKIQELAAHRAELEKMASNPVRDLSQTTPEAVQEYAAAQQERIGQRIADLEKIWESLEPPALKKRQEIQENLASYPAGGREQAEELVPTVQMILRQLKDWRMMSQVPNSRGSDINLLRLNAEQQNIPVNP